MYSKEEWEKAAGESLTFIKEIKKFIPRYSYADPTHSVATDENISEYLVIMLREGKKHLFDTIELLYELQVKGVINRLQKILDEMDIFSDEVKVKFHKEISLSKEWLRKLIMYDLHIIRESERLNKMITSLENHIIRSEEIVSEDVRRYSEEIRRQLGKVVALFKEREVLSTLEEIDLNRTFSEKQNEIRERYNVN